MNPALSVQGKLRAQHPPLQAFEPYVTADLNVDILRDGGFVANTQLRAGEGQRCRWRWRAMPPWTRCRARAKDRYRVLTRMKARHADSSSVARSCCAGEIPGAAWPGREPETRPALALDVKEQFGERFARVIVRERPYLQDIRKGAAAEVEGVARAIGAGIPTPAQRQAMKRFTWKPQRRSRPTPWRR